MEHFKDWVNKLIGILIFTHKSGLDDRNMSSYTSLFFLNFIQLYQVVLSHKFHNSLIIKVNEIQKKNIIFLFDRFWPLKLSVN